MSLFSTLRLARPRTRRGRKPRNGTARRLNVESLENRCLPTANIVFEWTDLLLDVSRLHSQGNQFASRALAMMDAAIYDSVNAIDHGYSVYHVNAAAAPGASAEAAAAQAAHDIAVNLYTASADVTRLNDTLTADLGMIPDGPSEDDGRALGSSVAAGIWAWR